MECQQQIHHAYESGEVPSVGHFGAGLTEADVLRFQAILREDCGDDVSLPEAWSRAIELLGLVDLMFTTLESPPAPAELSTGHAQQPLDRSSDPIN